jgi:hypothetical protein
MLYQPLSTTMIRLIRENQKFLKNRATFGYRENAAFHALPLPLTKRKACLTNESK